MTGRIKPKLAPEYVDAARQVLDGVDATLNEHPELAADLGEVLALRADPKKREQFEAALVRLVDRLVAASRGQPIPDQANVLDADGLITVQLPDGTLDQVDPREDAAVGRVSKNTMEWLVANEQERTQMLLRRVAELEPVKVKVGKKTTERILTKALKRFRKRLNEGVLEELVNKCAAGDIDELSEEQVKYIRRVKSAGDKLRAAFRLVDKSHEAPDELHNFVKHLGRLKDEMEEPLTTRGERLQGFWAKLDLDDLKAQMEPAGKRSTAEHLQSSLSEVRELLGRDRLRVPNFHKVRKKLRDILDFCRLLAKHGDAEDVADLRLALNTLNGILGEVHDQCVEVTRKQRHAKYKKLKVEIPAELAFLIDAITQKITA